MDAAREEGGRGDGQLRRDTGVKEAGMREGGEGTDVEAEEGELLYLPTRVACDTGL